LLISALFTLQNTLAQTDSHLALSNPYPERSETIMFTYKPEGTVLEGLKNITAVVFYKGSGDYPADIELKQEGNLLKGTFTITSKARAFVIVPSANNTIDGNCGNGYMFMLYKNKQPIEGAYATEARLLSQGLVGVTNIKRNRAESLDLYKKEFALYPQNENKYQFEYFENLAYMNEYRPIVNQKITDLEKSANELDLSQAVYLLNITGKKMKADSLDAVVRARFPNGRKSEFDAFISVVREHDPRKKDSLYNVYTKKYPANNDEEKGGTENLATIVANAYLDAGDLESFYKRAGRIKNKTGLAARMTISTARWAKAGFQLETAEEVTKLALNIIKEQIDTPKADAQNSPLMAKKKSQITYDGYADICAQVLCKEGKFEQALTYEQPVIDHGNITNTEVWEHYIQILAALGKYADAKVSAENCIKAGWSTEAIKNDLRNSYDNLKGNDTGFEEYLALLENPPKDVALPELVRKMINRPAPNFSLTDIYGKTVSLASLKGKIVIIDFGDTWCGHCEISFTRMQLAVDKYNDDPIVKFLFVDTEEHSNDFPGRIKKYVSDSHYNFNLCFEEKSGTANAFGVDGQSATFIVDKSGNIRFKFINFDGKPERMRDDIANMIELASKNN